MSVLARPLRAAVCSLLVLAGCAAVSPPAVAGPGCASGGRAVRYVVAFDRGTPESSARQQASAGCGQVAVYYPQISVAVVTSSDRAFADRLGPERTFSAQATRTAAEQPGAAAQPARAELPLSDPARVPAADLSAQQWDMNLIGAPAAHQVTGGSRSVVVGVLDSGVDPKHPDLAAAIDPEDSAGCLTGVPDPSPAAWQPTTSAHGTHVAGIIAAADDGKGITGVAPGVRIASVKVIDDRGYADPEAAVCGIMWSAARHLPIANSSWFVNPWSLSCVRGNDRGVVHEVLARAVEYATSQGTLNVAAATNEAVDLTPSAHSGSPSAAGKCEALPAGLRDVVTASAISQDRVKSGYSSYGLGVVDVTAPGGDDDRCVVSTVPGGYAPMCGTSMAAPHVAGVLALLKSVHPAWSAAELRRALDSRATPMPCPDNYDLTGDGVQDAYCSGYDGYNGFYGHGLVDARSAVAPAQTGGPSPAR
ncbi:S8 family serine peptidase [Amycolatopsis sp. NPDC059090]|uniref:S8 family peptidase n=1 Tax=unclassified Amycolatopsis TaxID=2618356 RepID=UPI003671AD67